MHNMFKLVAIAGAAACVSGTEAYADPLLLASYDVGSKSAGAPEDDFRVQIILVHEPIGGPLGLRLGEGILWEDGDTGIVDFNAGSGSDFDELAMRLTDGVDELLHIFTLNPDGGGGGSGWPESTWLGSSPDLVGNELDFIRLIVRDVRIEPWLSPSGLEGVLHDVDVTYQFWGEPIPEPATVAFLAFGAAALVRRRGLVGRSREHVQTSTAQRDPPPNCDD